MMSKLQYRAEYARSGDSKCREGRCLNKVIAVGKFRIGIEVPAPKGDFLLWKWYHEKCFFKKPRGLMSIHDLDNLHIIDNNDKTRLIDKIENIDMMRSYFAVDYCKSKTTCNGCDKAICKGEVRIYKLIFNTDTVNIGGRKIWYHLVCFSNNVVSLGYTAGSEDLPGINLLRQEDQDYIRDMLDSTILKNNVKRLKLEPEANGDILKMTEMEKQSELFHKYKELLNKYTKKDLQEILTFNSQYLPRRRRGVTDIVHHLADAFVFGGLQKCQKCYGQLLLHSYSYKCTGVIKNKVKCLFQTRDPRREPIRIPPSTKKVDYEKLRDLKTEVGVRLFEDEPPHSVIVAKKKPSSSSRVNTTSALPLSKLQFCIYGDIKTKKYNTIKDRIKRLGGHVANKLSKYTAGIFSTKQCVDEMSKEMQEIQEKGIEVLDVSFLDLVATEKGITVGKTIQLIKMHKISPWGSSSVNHIPVNSTSKLKKRRSSNKQQVVDTSTNTLIKDLKEGMDPDSDLVEIAHLYKDGKGIKYSVMLCKTDVDDNKNSYYRLQLLESDNYLKYWVFRAYGRTGTKRRDKHDNFSSKELDVAMTEFLKIFKAKTFYCWEQRHSIPQRYGYYRPVECGNDDIPLQVDHSCALPMAVQELIVKIFDINVMKRMLVDYEIDIDSIPLGKLSRTQIFHGFRALDQLNSNFHDGQIKPSESDIRGATNSFYQAIPHNLGSDKPPLLDNLEIVQKKIKLLNKIWELLESYKLIKGIGIEENVSPVELHYRKLNCEITPLPRDSPDYQLIVDYAAKAHRISYYTYKLEVEQAFKLVRNGEEERYRAFKQLDNRRLLWHGTRVTNLAGILAGGLRIAPPEVLLSGMSFGKGVYFADIVTNSGDYCYSNEEDPVCFILLCEVALGNMKQCYKRQDIEKLPAGVHSVWAVGRCWQQAPCMMADGRCVPAMEPDYPDKVDQVNLRYNEFVVYDVSQVNIKYLVQMRRVEHIIPEGSEH